MPRPDELPLGVVTDIFLRLPAKSLVRFRCLSKPICSLIDGHDFAKLHLNRSLAVGSNRSLILKDWYLYVTSLDSLSDATEITHPLNKVRGGTEVFGSSNGLLGVCNSETDIAIWNQSIGSYKRLPVAPVDLPGVGDGLRHAFYGFGHDPISDDYKVVRMVMFVSESGESFSAKVRVFSLRANAWKEIEEIPVFLRFLFQPYYCLLYRRGYGTYAAGVLHWVAPSVLECCKTKIVGFDLKNEKFGLVPQPECSDHNFQMDLGVLEGCLCVSCNYGNARVDIWVLKEYGAKESWTKLFRIFPSELKDFSGYVMPLVYSEGGDRVLMEVDNEKLVWYDWARRRSRRVKMKGAPRSFSAELYVGSLLLLNGGDVLERKETQAEEELRKDGRKKRDDFLSKGFKLVL